MSTRLRKQQRGSEQSFAHLSVKDPTSEVIPTPSIVRTLRKKASSGLHTLASSIRLSSVRIRHSSENTNVDHAHVLSQQGSRRQSIFDLFREEESSDGESKDFCGPGRYRVRDRLRRKYRSSHFSLSVSSGHNAPTTPKRNDSLNNYKHSVRSFDRMRHWLSFKQGADHAHALTIRRVDQGTMHEDHTSDPRSHAPKIDAKIPSHKLDCPQAFLSSNGLALMTQVNQRHASRSFRRKSAPELATGRFLIARKSVADPDSHRTEDGGLERKPRPQTITYGSQASRRRTPRQSVHFVDCNGSPQSRRRPESSQLVLGCKSPQIPPQNEMIDGLEDSPLCLDSPNLMLHVARHTPLPPSPRFEPVDSCKKSGDLPKLFAEMKSLTGHSVTHSFSRYARILPPDSPASASTSLKSHQFGSINAALASAMHSYSPPASGQRPKLAERSFSSQSAETTDSCALSTHDKACYEAIPKPSHHRHEAVFGAAASQDLDAGSALDLPTTPVFVTIKHSHNLSVRPSHSPHPRNTLKAHRRRARKRFKRRQRHHASHKHSEGKVDGPVEKFEAGILQSRPGGEEGDDEKYEEEESIHCTPVLCSAMRAELRCVDGVKSLYPAPRSGEPDAAGNHRSFESLAGGKGSSKAASDTEKDMELTSRDYGMPIASHKGHNDYQFHGSGRKSSTPSRIPVSVPLESSGNRMHEAGSCRKFGARHASYVQEKSGKCARIDNHTDRSMQEFTLPDTHLKPLVFNLSRPSSAMKHDGKIRTTSG